MVFKAALGDDARAILVDDRRELIGAIGGKTRLHQELDAANILDSVFGLDEIPQRFASRTELPGRFRGVLGGFPDDGKGRWVPRFFFHEILAPAVYLDSAAKTRRRAPAPMVTMVFSTAAPVF